VGRCASSLSTRNVGADCPSFADDDPKTAEVVSKILLLANDRQIKDPTILEQLRS
jgi:hypothetical protein